MHDTCVLFFSQLEFFVENFKRKKRENAIALFYNFPLALFNFLNKSVLHKVWQQMAIPVCQLCTKYNATINCSKCSQAICLVCNTTKFVNPGVATSACHVRPLLVNTCVDCIAGNIRSITYSERKDKRKLPNSPVSCYHCQHYQAMASKNHKHIAGASHRRSVSWMYCWTNKIVCK